MPNVQVQNFLDVPNQVGLGVSGSRLKINTPHEFYAVETALRERGLFVSDQYQVEFQIGNYYQKP